MPASIVTPYAFAWSIVDENGELGNYPFEAFQHREHQYNTLQQWLGRGGADKRTPHGGAALVTGFRGVGKTMLVNKVVFDAAVSWLFHPSTRDAGDASPAYGPFRRKDLENIIAARRLPEGAVLLLPVYLEIPRGLKPTELLGRLIRRTYFSVVRHGLGLLRPDLVRQIRLTYLRTLGADVEITERVKAKFGLSLDGVTKLEVTAEQEWEFAETLRLHSKEFNDDEAEDELLTFGRQLSHGRAGAAPGLAQRVGTGLRRGVEGLTESFLGTRGVPIHLVFVIDELDKLVQSRRGETTIPAAAPAQARAEGAPTESEEELLDTASKVIERIKALLVSPSLTAVVVAGANTELEWHSERTRNDPLLRSMFTPHVYVPQLGKLEVEQARGRGEDLGGALARTRGRWKYIKQDVSDAFLGDVMRNDPLAPLLTSWDDVAQRREMPDVIAASSDARDLIQLAQVLYHHGLPAYLRTPFGADLARSAMIQAGYKMIGIQPPAPSTPHDPASEYARALETLLGREPGGGLALGEIVDRKRIEPVIRRVVDLVNGLAGSAPPPLDATPGGAT